MPKPFKMIAILASLPLVFSLSATANAGKVATSFPKAVQGIWMVDNADGVAQCKQFRAATVETRFDTLAGAEIIGARMWHSSSEYGEGNFYVPKSMTKVGKTSWRASTSLEFDGGIHSPTSPDATIFMRLDKQKLIARVEMPKGNSVDAYPEATYFKCGKVPRDLYRAAG